jgi:hypothetical protein
MPLAYNEIRHLRQGTGSVIKEIQARTLLSSTTRPPAQLLLCQAGSSVPGLRFRYVKQYGGHYECPALDANRLAEHFHELCARYGIATRMELFTPLPTNRRQVDTGIQFKLFD